MNPRPKDVAVVTIIALVILYGVRNHGSIVAPSGPSYTAIVRESSADNAAFGQLVIGLRQGAAAEFFSKDGRRLYVLDDDGTDEAGTQVIPADSLKGLPLPAIQVYSKDWKLLNSESLPVDASVDSVLATSRRLGG